jgi:HAD superfamily hydrolase (TIGR01549 family)
MRDLILFDLDQTLIDSQHLAALRRQRRWNAVYEEIPRLQTYDGVVALWKGLEGQGRFLGVVTSSPRSYCVRVLNHLGLAPTVTVCYHDTDLHKPHPDPLVEAIERAGRFAGRAFYIGDKVDDMRAAAAAEMTGIGAVWGSEDPVLLQHAAHFAFQSPTELHTWLKH